MTQSIVRAGRPRADGSPAGDARAEILGVAAALFAERGYAGTSTRAIADQVGIRQASLYYHFAGKDEILLELLETSVRPSLDFALRVTGAADPAAALWALVATDVGTLLATPHNIGSLYLAHEVQGPAFTPFREHRAQLQAAYVEMAAALDAGGDARFLGACCMQLVEMVIPMRREGAEPPAGTAEAIADACLRVVGIDPGAVRDAAEGLLQRASAA